MGKKSSKKKRDESEVVLQQFQVTLAGQVHVVPEKCMKETCEFRRKLGDVLAEIAGPLLEDVQAGKIEGGMDQVKMIRRMLPALLSDGVDGVIELVWEYHPPLREFEAEATDGEILDAALTVLEVALPLVIRLAQTFWKILKRAGIELT